MDDGGILPVARITSASGGVALRVGQRRPGTNGEEPPAGGDLRARKEGKDVKEIEKVKELRETSENRSGAFFDLDGTLVPGPSLEKRFLRMLRYRREIGVRNFLRWAAEAARLMPVGFQQIVHANKMYLRGVRSFDERDGGGSNGSPRHKDGHQGGGQAFTPQRRNPRVLVHSFFEEAVDRLEWHAKQGHTIVLVSGTLEPLAQEAVRALEAELAQRGVAAKIGVCATRLEEADGHWTGQIVGEAMYGEAKALAVGRIAAEKGLDLARCYAYGNSKNDQEMLSAVGRPMAVNPSADLARTARKKGWPILRWEREKDLTQRAQRTQRPDSTKEMGRGLQACCANSGNGK